MKDELVFKSKISKMGHNRIIWIPLALREMVRDYEDEGKSKNQNSTRQLKILLLIHFTIFTANELTSNIPGSTIKCNSSKPRIEPLNTPPEILQKLRQELASNRLSPSAKQNKIRRITGFCSVCGELPTHYMIYDCGDVKKIERYCGPCLEKEKTKIY